MSKTVYTIAKNTSEEIRFNVDDYHGGRILNIRTWFREKNSGAWLPKKKGIAVDVKHIDAFVEGVRKLKAAVAEEG